MRALLALLLSLTLALASQAEAVARSEMAGETAFVVCGAAGQGLVVLDAAGHPVHGRPCPHCLAAAAVADLPPPPALPVPSGRAEPLALPPATLPSGDLRPRPIARGPPAFLA